MNDEFSMIIFKIILVSSLFSVMSSVTDQLIEITQFIQKARKLGITDKIISEDIDKTFPDHKINFMTAQIMDDLLDGKRRERTFWRAAYNYPVEGQTLDIQGDISKVVNCGFFTFDAEYHRCGCE